MFRSISLFFSSFFAFILFSCVSNLCLSLLQLLRRCRRLFSKVFVSVGAVSCFVYACYQFAFYSSAFQTLSYCRSPKRLETEPFIPLLFTLVFDLKNRLGRVAGDRPRGTKVLVPIRTRQTSVEERREKQSKPKKEHSQHQTHEKKEKQDCERLALVGKPKLESNFKFRFNNDEASYGSRR